MRRGGPRSERGKSRSRWNSTKHGLRSPAPVVPGLESEEDWEAHRQGVIDSLKPEGHLEEFFAERVALQSWRLHRVTRYEREVMAFSQELLDEELGMLSNIFVSGEANWLKAKHPQTMYGAYEHIREDQFLLERFLMSADDYSLDAEHAGRILRAMAEQVDEESRIEQVEVSGVVGPVNLAIVEEREIAWTSFMVAEAIDAMARAAVKDSAELAAAALSEARARSLGVMKRLAKMERVREILASDRPLPDDKTVENARYEAHISRQLYQALHELEALQARRAGGSAPLGRIDVQGLPEK